MEIKVLFPVLEIKYYIKVTVLPNNINSDMAHCFNNHFCQKILNIHSGFNSSTLSHGKALIEESCISMMDNFEPFTEIDIRQLLERSFSVVDPMPTWLVKGCLNVMIRQIPNIVNNSLSLDTQLFIWSRIWVKVLLFPEECRILYCWYSAMDDSKYLKAKW